MAGVRLAGVVGLGRSALARPLGAAESGGGGVSSSPTLPLTPPVVWPRSWRRLEGLWAGLGRVALRARCTQVGAGGGADCRGAGSPRGAAARDIFSATRMRGGGEGRRARARERRFASHARGSRFCREDRGGVGPECGRLLSEREKGPLRAWRARAFGSESSSSHHRGGGRAAAAAAAAAARAESCARPPPPPRKTHTQHTRNRLTTPPKKRISKTRVDNKRTQHTLHTPSLIIIITIIVTPPPPPRPPLR